MYTIYSKTMAVSTLNVDPDREAHPLEPNQGAVAIDASRFIEKTHQDAQRALTKELNDLVGKTPEEQRPVLFYFLFNFLIFPSMFIF